MNSNEAKGNKTTLTSFRQQNVANVFQNHTKGRQRNRQDGGKLSYLYRDILSRMG